MRGPILGPVLGFSDDGSPDDPSDPPPAPVEVLEAFDDAVEFYDAALIAAFNERRSDEFGTEVASLLGLPEAMADSYDHHFVRRLCWTFGEVVRKLVVDQSCEWACVAEELVAASLLRQTADWLVELHDVGQEMSEAASQRLIAYAESRSETELRSEVRGLYDYLFEDLDWQHLYSQRPESIAAVRGELSDHTGMVPLDLLRWFEPYSDDRIVHPLASGLVI